MIQAWAKIIEPRTVLRREFRSVPQELPEAQRQEILNRLQLARDFASTREPLDFFRSWKTPLERYMRHYLDTSVRPEESERKID